MERWPQFLKLRFFFFADEVINKGRVSEGDTVRAELEVMRRLLRTTQEQFDKLESKVFNMRLKWHWSEKLLIHVTNRFHVSLHLFSNRSQEVQPIVSCTDVLTTFLRLLWSSISQTYGNMESIWFIWWKSKMLLMLTSYIRLSSQCIINENQSKRR